MTYKIKPPYSVSIASVAACLLAMTYVQAAETPAPVPNIGERVKVLDEQLYTGKDAIKVEAQDMAVMTKAAQDLAAAMPHPGLAVGAKAPNFTLNNPYGKPVKLSSLLRKGPVILVFYRGAWCPYCNLELKALQEKRLPYTGRRP